MKLQNLQALSTAKILVIGDLILDHYITGSTDRTSPEAPVPVVLWAREHEVPGGAANVARNLAVLGVAKIGVCGLVGEDGAGQRLCTALEELGVETAGITRVPSRPTTTKTRITSQGQQIVRLDRETHEAVGADAVAALVRWVEGALEEFNGVVLSDYAKGVLGPAVVEVAVRLGRERGIPVLVDPKGTAYERYRGCFALTPNAREAAEATGIRLRDRQAVAAAGERLLEMTGADFTIITCGADGYGLFEQGAAPAFAPTVAREVFDVTGAGDTFVGFLAAGIAAGLPAREAAAIANGAAGVVVGKVGAATVTLTELRAALAAEGSSATARKLRSPEELAELGRDLRAAGKRVVFTNGCFDFIHSGHVEFLAQARALGDVLVLATNRDEVIRRLKGAPRPIIKQGQREKLLAAIEPVDFVVPFPQETPHELIAALRPDVLVKGSNYAPDEVEGHEIVEGYGGEIRLLPVDPGVSTRELLGG